MTTNSYIDYPELIELLQPVRTAIDAVLDSDDMDDVIVAVAEHEGTNLDVEPGERGEVEALEAEDRIRARAMLALLNELVQSEGLVDYVSISFPRV